MTIHHDETSSAQLGNNVILTGATIVLKNNSTLVIEDGVKIDKFDLFLDNGSLHIGKYSKLESAYYKNPVMTINNGKVKISNNCIIRSDILCSFGGQLEIGQYTDIAQQTDIRCAEFISIGEFNMISYECLIFDNNTHEIMPFEKRRQQTMRDFPRIGLENSKPSSKKITIGNDVWIGQRASILKGTVIEDTAIIGLGAVVAGKRIPAGCIAVGNPARVISKKNENY